MDCLDLKCPIAVLGIDREIILRDKRNFFIRRLGTQDVAKGNILESFRLTDIVKIGNIDTAIVSENSYE